MADPIEKKLDRLLKLTQENNEILRGMRKHQRWSSFFRMVYWAIIIIIALTSFYLVQPYVEALINAYKDLAEGAGKVKEASQNIPIFPDLGSIFDR